MYSRRECNAAGKCLQRDATWACHVACKLRARLTRANSELSESVRARSRHFVAPSAEGKIHLARYSSVTRADTRSRDEHPVFSIRKLRSHYLRCRAGRSKAWERHNMLANFRLGFGSQQLCGTRLTQLSQCEDSTPRRCRRLSATIGRHSMVSVTTWSPRLAEFDRCRHVRLPPRRLMQV